MNRTKRYGLKTVSTWWGAERLRVVGLVTGSIAGLAMIIVGCSSVTQGSATGNRTDAPAYRTSVSKSMEASASSSAARESDRQKAAITDAVHTSCDAFGPSSSDALDAVNAYINAHNANAANEASLLGPAVDALNRSADSVDKSLTSDVPADLSSALTAYSGAARKSANVLAAKASPDDTNTALQGFDDTRGAANSQCKALY